MKLLTCSIGEDTFVGKTDGVNIASLTKALGSAASDMVTLMDSWESVVAAVERIDAYDIPLSSVRVRPPVLRPGKIMGIGLNYADHVAEAAMELPKDQVWFSKASTAVNGPYDPIQRPRVSGALDYEAELVVVIGKRCRHVEAGDAHEVIFGFCAGNDVSVRDWQLKTSQFILGKSFDTHAPFGPWIVTRDETDAADLPIRAYVNGELRQDSRTRHLIFDCAAQIAHLSQAMTLEPGDLIFTGTPAGVGAAMKPPVWLKAGDVVRVEIEGVGGIENTVVDE